MTGKAFVLQLRLLLYIADRLLVLSTAEAVVGAGGAAGDSREARRAELEGYELQIARIEKQL